MRVGIVEGIPPPVLLTRRGGNRFLTAGETIPVLSLLVAADWPLVPCPIRSCLPRFGGPYLARFSGPLWTRFSAIFDQSPFARL